MRLALALVLATLVSNPAHADFWPSIVFGSPTDRYGHGVLGDAIEYGSLDLVVSIQGTGDVVVSRIELSQDRVFEDLHPRLFDLDDPLSDHVAVVETQQDAGASLAVYRIVGGMFSFDATLEKIAATPHIGQRNRWLAPAGIADFDGDGQNDIAYVETPHLGKILKIVTLKGDQLVPIVEPLAGVSNHKIGQDFITSDVRQCDGRIELLTPNADWTALIAVRIEEGRLVADETPFEPSLAGIRAAQECE